MTVNFCTCIRFFIYSGYASFNIIVYFAVGLTKFSKYMNHSFILNTSHTRRLISLGYVSLK